MFKKNIFLSMILSFLLLAVFTTACSNLNVNGSYKIDAQTLADYVEQVHPAFLLDEVPASYDAAKANYIKSCKSNLSKEQFTLLTMQFLSSLQDSKTSINEPDSKVLSLFGKCVMINNELVLLDENNQPSNKKIIEIGNKPITEIFDAVDTYFALENEYSHSFYCSNVSLNKAFLEYLGYVIENDQICVTFEKNGEITKENVPFIQYQRYPDEAISSRLIGDMYYIDMNLLVFDDATFNTQLTLINNALASNIHKVIIDLRDNMGGNLSYGIQLLEALGMGVPNEGLFERYSLHTAYARETSSTGTNVLPPSVTFAYKNPEVELVVLINENTLNTALAVASYVQDGKLGTVIGVPSAGAPSFYADTVSFDLPYSGLNVFISSSKYYRPDENADQKTLYPDIMTEVGEDALKRAMSYLKTI